jgi:hypothetical protein
MSGSWVLLKEARAVFVGSILEEPPKYRFRVDENIKGVKGDSFEVEAVPFGAHFEVGKQYLVFLDYVLPLDDGEHLFAPTQADTTNRKPNPSRLKSSPQCSLILHTVAQGV